MLILCFVQNARFCPLSIQAKGAEEADKIVDLLKKVAARANSDEEPDCHGYVPGRSRDDPNTIIVFGKLVYTAPRL